MVLNATDTFEYESSETGKKKMFHATGATLDNLYHMKVFNIDLKEKFTKNKFLLISNYIKNIEFLIIDKDSSVFKVTPDEKIEIPNSLTKNVRETPQISAIQENTVGKLISGLFVLHK
ncbi:interferon activated gene 202B, isoform CRA_a, partial [Mus musculus]